MDGSTSEFNAEFDEWLSRIEMANGLNFDPKFQEMLKRTRKRKSQLDSEDFAVANCVKTVITGEENTNSFRPTNEALFLEVNDFMKSPRTPCNMMKKPPMLRSYRLCHYKYAIQLSPNQSSPIQSG